MLHRGPFARRSPRCRIGYSHCENRFFPAWISPRAASLYRYQTEITPLATIGFLEVCEKFRLEFFLARHADVRNEARVGGTQVLEIPASFAEAKVAIDSSADLVCVAVILTVILPPANLA
jgi:hypothetical protein